MGILLVISCAVLLGAAAQTSSPCGPAEVLDECPVECPSDYCPQSDGQVSNCPKPDECPPPACKCRFNYRRDENNECIPTRECPPFDCSMRPNMEFNPCPPFCPDGTCSQATPDGKCPLPGRIGIVLRCQPACKCIKGYWLKEGVCVPYEECNQNNSAPGLSDHGTC